MTSHTPSDIADAPTARLLDGKALARELKPRLAEEIAAFRARTGVAPALEVLLVGDEPDSVLYAERIVRWSAGIGLACALGHLSEDSPEEAVLAEVRRVSADPATHGLLIQMPLPPPLSAQTVLAALDPLKDVEGLHPENAGRLASGYPRFAPTTPLAGMELLRAYGVELRGRHAVILGRSNVVGKPLAQLLLAEDASVTLLHSRSTDVAEHLRRADLVCAAAGRPELVRGDMLRPGAVVLDFGINFVDGRIVGDVAFEEAARVASMLTPVPGGIGPLTNLMLARNALRAAELQTRGKGKGERGK